jgi:hypothetical protein
MEASFQGLKQKGADAILKSTAELGELAELADYNK